MTDGQARLPGGLVAALHAALRAYARQREAAWLPLQRFLPRLFAQHEPETILQAAWARLAEDDPDAAQLLRARFWQGRTVQALSIEAHIAPSTFYARQRAAIRRLAWHLWAMEREQHQAEQATWAHKTRHLPPATYTRLFGFEPALQQLRTWLLRETGPRWVLIEGLGGLGKTSLAHAFVLATLDAWQDVAWVSAYAHRPAWEAPTPRLNTERLTERVAWQLGWDDVAALPPERRVPELRRRLGAHAYLIVFDDLLPETLTRLLPQLPGFPAPSRFLITTRYRLGLDGGAHLPMRELGQQDSLALLRHEIAQRGLPQPSDDALLALYERVGGNPLALKLVVGQLGFLPLQHVLARLPWAAQLGEDFFAYIYQPLLDRLPPDARAVLQAMPYFAPEGATYEELQAFTHLPPRRLDDALYRLVHCALLDFDPRPPARYAIHRLTYVYLTRNAS